MVDLYGGTAVTTKADIWVSVVCSFKLLLHLIVVNPALNENLEL